ncbi:hypothetical protein Bcell_0313 [Evansella cellulosilytica DSM 2522]|uniref:Rhodanese domain-containing protein n=1 Tax=Evansella cellulosilytica (strain ATCC 21833 / DSM 2522 / FERM P-1141 / JCM 9156 / N-4) TaxID=649639 RepID=E6TV16_EVAC2|nr:hypothetical protein Bcell_0313 [Evansella cellulosilytica DSM 2522]
MAALVAIPMLYMRYYPVASACMTLHEVNECKDGVIVDVRDYNMAYKEQFDNKKNIPLPYLHRFYGEIEAKKVIVLSSDIVSRNLSIRFLRKKGFIVIGYSIIDPKNIGSSEHVVNKKRRHCHEI